MSRNKQQGQPFPFSAYVLKSFSTQHSHKIAPQEVYSTSSIQNINQYLNILELNTKIQKQPLILKKPRDLTISEAPILKKHPNSEKVSIVPSDKASLMQESVESQSPTIPQHRSVCKSRLKTKTLSPVKKKRVIDSPKIRVALRYSLLTVFSLIGRRQDYMNSLKGRGESALTPLRNSQIDDILTKF